MPRLPSWAALVSGPLAAWGAHRLAWAALSPAARGTAMPWLLAVLVGAGVVTLLVAPRRAAPGRWRWASLALLASVVAQGLILAHDPRAIWADHVRGWGPEVSLAAATLWFGGWIIERQLRRRLPALTAAMVALSLTAAGLSTSQEIQDVVVDGHAVRAWNIYHYSLGSKYFAELGYDQLYAATLAADDLAVRAGIEPNLGHVEVTRDMHSYGTVKRSMAVARLPLALHDDRDLLMALHRDLRGLLPYERPRTWRGILGDLGYNPAPAWPVIGKPLAILLGTRGAGLRVLSSLDIPLFAATFFALLWAWGPRVTAGAVLFVTLCGFNEGRLFGGFLQYDWLASLVVGVALYRKGYGAWGGVVLSWAAMTRVFPGFLVFPVLIGLALARWRGEVIPRRSLRFAAAFTLACGVWFLLSHTTGRGLQTWPEWVQTIRHHSKLHGSIGRARLGLGRLAAHSPTPDDWWGAVERSSSIAVADTFDARVRPWRVLAGLVLLLALFRRREADRMLLMLVLAWIVVVTSRYYGSSWLLLLTLGLPERGDAGREQSLPGVLAATGVLLVPAAFHSGEANEQIYFQVNYAFLATAALALFAWLVHDIAAARTEAPGARVS